MFSKLVLIGCAFSLGVTRVNTLYSSVDAVQDGNTSYYYYNGYSSNDIQYYTSFKGVYNDVAKSQLNGFSFNLMFLPRVQDVYDNNGTDYYNFDYSFNAEEIPLTNFDTNLDQTYYYLNHYIAFAWANTSFSVDTYEVDTEIYTQSVNFGDVLPQNYSSVIFYGENVYNAYNDLNSNSSFLHLYCDNNTITHKHKSITNTFPIKHRIIIIIFIKNL